MKKLTTILAAILLLFIVSGCKKSSTSTSYRPAIASDASTKGINSAIPAYYDSKLFTILFVEFPPTAEATQIAKNPNINFIYQSDNGLPDNQPFISVIDAIPGDGMNPI